MFIEEILNNYSTQILDAKYEQADTNKVDANQKQLKFTQCHDYKKSWLNMIIFCGSLGEYSHQKVHIDSLPGLDLAHHQAYLVPCAHEQTFKEKLQQMLVLESSKNTGP